MIDWREGLFFFLTNADDADDERRRQATTTSNDDERRRRGTSSASLRFRLPTNTLLDTLSTGSYQREHVVSRALILLSIV